MFYKYVKHFCIFRLVSSSLQESEKCRLPKVMGIELNAETESSLFLDMRQALRLVGKVCCHSRNSHHDFCPCPRLWRSITAPQVTLIPMPQLVLAPSTSSCTGHWPLCSTLLCHGFSCLVFLRVSMSAPICSPHLCLCFYAAQRIMAGSTGFLGVHPVRSHSALRSEESSAWCSFSSAKTLNGVTSS